VPARMEGKSKIGRLRKSWIVEVEEDLKAMRIRIWYAVARDRQEWRKILLEAKVHNRL
jgi:hypothetical protein